jgi:hypothetical protein
VDGAHARKLDDKAVVAQRAAADVVAAADRREQIVRASEGDRSHDIRESGAARDEPRAFVHAGIPNLPRVVVTCVCRLKELAVKCGFENLDVHRGEASRHYRGRP